MSLILKIFTLQIKHNNYLQTKALFIMEQQALKNVNNCVNTNIYSYLETSSGKISSLYLKAVHLFNTSVN